jgi:hypothetical protein
LAKTIYKNNNATPWYVNQAIFLGSEARVIAELSEVLEAEVSGGEFVRSSLVRGPP